MIYAAACHFARWSAAAFAHPVAIVLVPVGCWAWMRFGGDELTLTLLLSVLAITTTQLVLLSQDRDTKALHAKLDELLRGVPEADARLAGMEKN